MNKMVDIDDEISSYKIDAKSSGRRTTNAMGASPRVGLPRMLVGDGVHHDDAGALLDANLQRLIARLHQMNFFESFVITSQNVLRDIRETLGVGKKSQQDDKSSENCHAQKQESCKKEVAKNIFLVTTECRFRCNIYLVNPGPPDKTDESAFEVNGVWVRGWEREAEYGMQCLHLGLGWYLFWPIV